jgi:hypothetical protein
MPPVHTQGPSELEGLGLATVVSFAKDPPGHPEHEQRE